MLRRHLDALPRNGIFVDLGANLGEISEIALEYGHQVFAFEPDPYAFSKLRGRVGSNPRTTLFPKAIGASNRTARFFRRPDADWGHFSKISSLNELDEHIGGRAIEVEVIDIVDFLRGLPQPATVIKMDIEGAEAECLEAILDSGCHRSAGLILVETHERFSPDIGWRIARIRERIGSEGITNIDLGWI